MGGIGSDNVIGGSGDDFVLGDNGSDALVMGGEGRDLIFGGRGADRLAGGEGGDQFVSGPIEETSQNTLSGGGGNDIFLVDNVPASKDVVSCGSGFDRLVADGKDAIAPDCEKVVVVHGSIDEVFEQEGEFFGSLPPAVSEFWDTFFDRLAPDPVDNS